MFSHVMLAGTAVMCVSAAGGWVGHYRFSCSAIGHYVCHFATATMPLAVPLCPVSDVLYFVFWTKVLITMKGSLK